MLGSVGRWLSYIVVGLLLILLLAFTLLPLAARLGVVYWFEQQGMQAQFQHLSIAPAAGRIELAGLQLSRDQSEQLNVGQVLVDINLLPLLDRQLQISEFKVSGLFVNSQFADRKWHVAGLDIQKLLKSTAQQKPEASPQAATNQAPLSVAIKSLVMEDVRFCASAEQASVKQADFCLAWDDLLNHDAIRLDVDAGLLVRMPGDIQLRGLQLEDNLQQLSVVRWGNLTLGGLEYDATAIALHKIRLQQLQVMQRDKEALLAAEFPSHLQLTDLNVEKLLLNTGAATQVNLQRAVFGGIDVLILRDAERIAVQRRVDQLLRQLQSFMPEPASSVASQVAPQVATESAQNDAPTTFQLDELSVTNDSRVVYLDTHVQPQVEQRLDNLSLSFGPLNTAAVDQPAKLSLSIDINQFSKLSANGWVKPLSEKLNMEIQLQVDGYDPLAVSPYVERALQYKIQRGQLHNSLDVAINENQLDIESELILEKFYLEDLQPEELAAGEKAQSLPVATAMNLLRDSDDRITIKLPITGDVSDPSFSLSQVVGVVMKKALTQAVINYYTPFGLVNIASALADSATQLRFEPLPLAAGQTTTGAGQQQRLEQLAGLLQAKQALSLSFCPSVTAADALHMMKLDKMPEQGLSLTAEQQQQLRQLGIDRGRAVKASLLESGASASQVILCQASIDLTAPALPQIAISI